jgi:hypothetical protein
MKISKNIQEAEKNYPNMYHVASSNEVHSFESLEEANEDLINAFDAESGSGTKFTPILINN